MSSSLLLDAAELKFVRVLGGHADGGGNADLSIMPDQLSDGDTMRFSAKMGSTIHTHVDSSQHAFRDAFSPTAAAATITISSSGGGRRQYEEA